MKELLNNALRQTGWPAPPLTETSWPTAVAERLANLDWRRLATDVEPFLEPHTDPTLFTEFTEDNLRHLLARTRVQPRAQPLGGDTAEYSRAPWLSEYSWNSGGAMGKRNVRVPAFAWASSAGPWHPQMQGSSDPVD